MLGGEVVEGEQRLAVFGQALDGLVVLDAIGFDERIQGSLGGVPGLRHPDVLQCTLGFGLQALGCQSAANRDPLSASKRDPFDRRALASAGGVILGSTFEAPAVVSGFDDIAVVGEAIEQCGRHFGVGEDARPFTEGEIGGDDD